MYEKSLCCYLLLVIVLVDLCGVYGSNSLSAINDKTHACLPQNVHLSFGDVYMDMVVMWSTVEDCSTTVHYDHDPWSFKHEATGTKLSLGDQQPLKFIHRVVLKNLKPDQTYYYRPVSNQVARGPLFFKTRPSSLDWSPQFMVYGDINLDTTSISYITNEILTGQYTAIFNSRDFTFQNDAKNAGEFLKAVEGFTSVVPYMTSPGNKELTDNKFEVERKIFSTPKTKWPIPADKMWYSIDVGPVHLISFSTEVFYSSSKEYKYIQRDWLTKDLKENNLKRDKQPWVVAIGHRPLYCSNLQDTDCSSLDSTVRAGFEDLFYEYGVDIVLTTHDTSYERLYPTYKNVVLSENYVNPQAPVQIITGSTGSNNITEQLQNTSKASWSALYVANISTESIGSLQIVNTTHARWQQKLVTDSSLLDSVWIVQKKHGPFKRDQLPKKVEEKIEETIKKTSAKPAYIDNSDKEAGKLFEKDKKQRIYIGVAFGAMFVALVIVVVVIKGCRRRHRAKRRWESMDFNYGKKFYSTPQSDDKNEDLDNDFEIDMSEGTLPTTKLLNDD